MKLTLWISYLSVAARAAAGAEPTGGLAGAALTPSELRGRWTRRIEALFDPNANPTEIFQVATNSSWLPVGETADTIIARQTSVHRHFLSTTLASLGAEAQIILEFHDANNGRRFSMFIYRYKTAEGLEDMWKRRRESTEFNVKRLGAQEIIYTKKEESFPGGVKASKPSVEEREGRYHIMVSPCEPEPDDPGLNLVRKQVAKLLTPPRRSIESNGPPSVN